MRLRTGISFGLIGLIISRYKKLKDLNVSEPGRTSTVAVKEAVFPFSRFEADILLGPEMKSTGEVMGIDQSFGMAIAKAQASCDNLLPVKGGTIIVTVNDRDKSTVAPILQRFHEMGFEIVATKGTHEYLKDKGIPSEHVYKVGEGRPNVVDAIKNGEVQLVINTPLGAQSRFDEYEIGRSAIRNKITTITTISGAQAAVRGIRNLKTDSIQYHSLQEIFS